MLMGIDVFHASNKKSILAVVGTVDKDFGRYFSDIRIQDEG